MSDLCPAGGKEPGASSTINSWSLVPEMEEIDEKRRLIRYFSPGSDKAWQPGTACL